MRNLKQFVVLVVVPIVMAAAGVTTLTLDLVSRLSTGANAEDHRRTAEVVKSAMLATEEEVAKTVADNANWDDAAVELHRTAVDHEYVNLTWGEASASGVLYDIVFVVDARGGLLSGYIEGERTGVDPDAFLGGRLKQVLKELPQNATEPATASTLVLTEHGPVAFAAGNFVPTSAGVSLEMPAPRFLVLGNILDDAFFTALGERYVVDGLVLLPGRAEGFVALQNRFGDHIGTLQWKDRRPGDVTRAAVMYPAVAMLLILITVMAAIAFICWRQFRLIEARERQARYSASHDALTGLPNRVELIRHMSAGLSHRGVSLAVLFVDLDGFKDVNDTYDHATGDLLIRAVAAGFTALLPPGAMIGRIGGDEFLIVIEGNEAPAAARLVAARILSFLAQPFDLEGRIARVGASVGMAHVDGENLSAGELMRRADVAMYAAKARHKNRLEVYVPAMDAARDDAAAILDELRLIVSEDRIEIAYQPIIDADTLEICGVEALARWPSNSSRRIGPDQFIAAAESSGLINKLGLQIIEKACRDAMAWGELRLSINISPVQLRDPNFASLVLSAIRQSGIETSRVELEITEGRLIEQAERISGVFEELRKAGVSIALDDFGSGYSSIAYLRQLHFDRIKIDRSITSQMLTSESARTVIQATGLIAHGLHAMVTAEGVEAEEEIQLLRLAGCNELQGYLFGKPQSAQSIGALLQSAVLAVRTA